MSTQNFVEQLLAGGSQDYADLEKIAGPEALAVLDELEKTAAASDIDLNDFSDEQIVDLIREAMGAEEGGYADYEDVEKVASAPGSDFPAGVDMEKVAAADYLGRVQAHAMADELSGIWGEGVEKTAGVEDIDQDQFEQLAAMNANDILYALDALEGEEYEAVEGREKVAALDLDEELTDLIGQRTAQLLDENGWDVDAIAEALQQG